MVLICALSKNKKKYNLYKQIMLRIEGNSIWGTPRPDCKSYTIQIFITNNLLLWHTAVFNYVYA